MWIAILTIVVAAVLGLIWSWHHYKKLKEISVSGHLGMVEDEIGLQDEKTATMGAVQIGSIIHEGAS